MRHVSAFLVALGLYMLSWIFVPGREIGLVLLFAVGVLVFIAGIELQRAKEED